MIFATPTRPWPGRLEPLWWAARALRRETLGFRFDYPIEVVTAAGPRESPHYYIYSHHLFFDAMQFDPDGIPTHRARTFGRTYNPAYVAWYALTSLQEALRGPAPEGTARFWRQLEWLVSHAVRRDGGAIVWPYTADFYEGSRVLKAPWVCAMAQGLAISALVRGYRLTGRAELLDLCGPATRVFERDVADGGVRTVERGHVLYEEYPVLPPPRILDGFLFSLLGLYDLAAQTGDGRVQRLFADGVEGLAQTLPSWDYRNKWSRYGTHGYLCPPSYNKLNAALLASLARLSGNATLTRYADAWDPRRLAPRDRAEVFLAFLATKNLSRIRHATWRRPIRRSSGAVRECAASPES